MTTTKEENIQLPAHGLR